MSQRTLRRSSGPPVHDIPHLLDVLASWQPRIKLSGNHRYSVDGKYRPGVTTVIKTLDAPRLDEWKVRVQVEGTARAAYSNPPLQNEPLDAYVARLKKLGAEEYEHQRLADEAARIGQDVHSLIEHAVKGMLGQAVEKPQVCEEALFRFAGWREWADSKGLKPLAAEMRVHSLFHDYCGTVDLLSLVEGDVSVIDAKPTAIIYPERRLQLAGYRAALMSMGWPAPRGFILCLPRDGGDIEMIEVDPTPEELNESLQAFINCLELYQWQLGLERKARKERRVA